MARSNRESIIASKAKDALPEAPTPKAEVTKSAKAKAKDDNDLAKTVAEMNKAAEERNKAFEEREESSPSQLRAPTAKEKEAEEAKKTEAEEAPQAQEGSGLANNRDCGVASARGRYPSSWEAFRGEENADGFFACPLCGWKSKARGKQHERALQDHVWSKACAGDGHPPIAVQERWYPGWTTVSAKKKRGTWRE